MYIKIKMSVRPSVCMNSEFLRGYFYSGLNKNMDNCLDGNYFAFCICRVCFEIHICFIEKILYLAPRSSG